MRFATILAGALCLSACSGKQEADAVANADTGLTADHITANDVTAIDAVTGEAANMAADVNFVEESNAVDGNVSTSAGQSAARPISRSRDEAAPPATSNTAATAETETNAQ